MASPYFPEPPPHQEPTSIAELDRLVEELEQKRKAWVETSLAERVALLEECLNSTKLAAREWVETGCLAKGVEEGTQQEGELWFSGPVVLMRNLRLLVASLKAGGEMELPGWEERPDGQKVARVFPLDLNDKMFMPKVTGEVWIEPGKPPTQGALYRKKNAGESGEGGTCLVLGAGNISGIGVQDAVHRLFYEDEVAIVKCNPVNDWVGPQYVKAMRPLIDAGFLAVCYGGAEQGAHLVHHPKISSIHITGSDSTHDRIVWGSPDEQAQRKKEGRPICTKPIASELGGVTPVVVVPGDWTDKDIDSQARHVAGMVAHNASFNCNAAKVLVLPSGWALKDRFVHKVREVLAFTGPRKAYYPGARERYEAFLKEYPNAIPLGEEGEEIVPWTVIPDVPIRKGEYALTNEAFCGVLAEVEVEASSAEEFLRVVGKVCNEDIWGTLSCMIIIDGKTEKAHKEAFEDLLGELRYGAIAINCWAGLVYGLGSTSWGAYPGHTPEDVVSGIGFVHNSFMIDYPEKSVVRAPFRPLFKHIWDPTNKTVNSLGPKMCAFERSPSLFRLVGLAFGALRG